MVINLCRGRWDRVARLWGMERLTKVKLDTSISHKQQFTGPALSEILQSQLNRTNVERKWAHRKLFTITKDPFTEPEDWRCAISLQRLGQNKVDWVLLKSQVRVYKVNERVPGAWSRCQGKSKWKDQRMDKEIKRGEVVHGSIMGQTDAEKKIN